MTRRIVLGAMLCAFTGCVRVPASQSALGPVAAVATEAEPREEGEPDAPWLGATEAEPEPAEEEAAEPAVTGEAAVERAKTLFMEGQRAFRVGDFAAAAAKFEEALQLAPDKWALAFNAGKAWERAGDCGRAMPMFQHALARADASMRGDVQSAMNGCGSRP